MNKVFLMGRTTSDPEVRYSSGANAMAIAKFNLAVNRMGKDKGADFISCIAFGKTAETFEKYVFKGQQILVEGHWQTGSYENKDGKKVYTNDCVVDRFEFAGEKKAESQPDEDGFINIPEGVDSELPF